MNIGTVYEKLKKTLSLFFSSSFLILLFTVLASAQVVVVSPKSPVAPKSNVKIVSKPEKVVVNKLDIDCTETVSENMSNISEKAISVSEKVNISMCVREGQVKVNGWNRNEIRAFVNNGEGLGFSVLEKSKSDKKPVWVKVLGYDPAKEGETEQDECLSGKIIELDVPFGATVNIKSGESKTTIDSVSKVFVKNVGGDIFLNNIKQGVEALTYRGNVTVKNSGGSMSLETTNGNIIAYDVSSEEIGDSFQAKTTSGAITLQQIKYRETEIHSSSGSISFVGGILNGGQYYFGAPNGLITMILPEDTSAKVIAVYGYGNFESIIPMKDMKRDEKAKLGSLSGTLGKGGALLNFKTVTGKIFIKKSEE